MAVIAAVGTGVFWMAAPAPATPPITSIVTTLTIGADTYPSMGVFDDAGNFFVINQGNRTISKITPLGEVTPAWVTLPVGWQSNTIAIDASGNLYMPDEKSPKVAKVTPDGTVNGTWSTTLGASNAGQGIAIDASGNVFVANQGNNTISKIQPDGTTTAAWATMTVGAKPFGLAFDDDGNLYVANRNSGNISKILPNGSMTEAWAALGSNTWPYNMVFDSAGNLFVAVFDGNRVAKITPDATVTQSWATVSKPLGITVDADDNIFVSSYNTTDVVKVTPAGTKTTFATLPGGAGSMALAFDSAGALYSSNSDGGTVSVIQPVYLPTAPGIVSVAPGDTTAALVVSPSTANGTPVTGYEYSVDDGDNWATLTTGAGSNGNLDATLTGLDNGTTYSVTVRAQSLAGPSEASAARSVTPGTPNAPTIVSATPADSGADLVVTPPTSTNGSAVTDYEYSVNAGSNWVALSVGAGTNGNISGTITGLTNGTPYAVIVRARNTNGAGPASGSASVTPATVPDAPEIVSATTANAGASLVVTPPGDDGGSAVTSYEYSVNAGTTWATLTTSAGSNGNLNAGITGLTNGTAYSVTVRARNARGPGAASGPASVTPTTVPGAPTALTASSAPTGAGLTFAPPADTGGSAITSYEYSVDAGTNWTTVTTGAGTDGNRTASITGLTNGTTYSVTVRARNARGTGGASEAASVTPRPVPQSVIATAGVSSITVNWSAPGDTSGIVDYTATASPGPATCKSEGTATSCKLGAVAGTSYTVTVVANTSTGASAPSAASLAAVPTQPEPPAEPPSDAPLTLTTDKGKITTAEPGQAITFVGEGFMAHSTVLITLYSTPIELGTATTDGDGNFTTPITIPADLAVGAHTALAQGVAPNGQPMAMRLALTVAEADGSDTLARTGVAITRLAVAGSVLLAVGAGLVMAARPRRRIRLGA